MKKGNWWILLLVLFGFGSLWYILSKFSLGEIIGTFRAASQWYLVGYIIAVTLIMAALAWRWKVILISQGHHYKFLDLLRYKIVGFGVNFVTPGPRVGGEPVQATLLSRRYGIPFDKALSSIVIDKTLELWTSGLFFILGVVLVFFRFALPKDLMWLLLTLSVIFAILMVWFIVKMLQGKAFFTPIMRFTRISRIPFVARYERKLVQFERLIVRFYEHDKKYFGYAILVSFVSWLLMFFEYYFAMQFFGYSITPLQTFLIFSFVGAAYLFPIPLALGVLEAAQVSVFNILGINPAAGVGLAMVIRFKDVIWSGIGFFFLFLHSLSSKKDLIGEAMKESIEDSSLLKEIDVVEPDSTPERPPEQHPKQHSKQYSKAHSKQPSMKHLSAPRR